MSPPVSPAHGPRGEAESIPIGGRERPCGAREAGNPHKIPSPPYFRERPPEKSRRGSNAGCFDAATGSKYSPSMRRLASPDASGNCHQPYWGADHLGGEMPVQFCAGAHRGEGCGHDHPIAVADASGQRRFRMDFHQGIGHAATQGRQVALLAVAILGPFGRGQRQGKARLAGDGRRDEIRQGDPAPPRAGLRCRTRCVRWVWRSRSVDTSGSGLARAVRPLAFGRAGVSGVRPVGASTWASPASLSAPKNCSASPSRLANSNTIQVSDRALAPGRHEGRPQLHMGLSRRAHLETRLQAFPLPGGADRQEQIGVARAGRLVEFRQGEEIQLFQRRLGQGVWRAWTAGSCRRRRSGRTPGRAFPPRWRGTGRGW
jgi:hypothetical protein